MRVHAIGGYSEIGRNMSAIEFGRDAYVLDMGVWLEKIIAYEGDPFKLGELGLKKMEAIPQDAHFRARVGKKVRAIICTHAHLDHCWSIPLLAPHYKAPIFSTPFALEVINQLIKQAGPIQNELCIAREGEEIEVGEARIEPIRVTHSIPQTSIVVLHTKKGAIVYANDYKFDANPIYWEKTDFKRLKQLGKEGVFLLMSDSTRVEREGACPPESAAREMIVSAIEMCEGSQIFFTTFSSHLARIKYAIELAEERGKSIYLLGRSLANYVEAALKWKLIQLPGEVKVFGFKRGIIDALKEIKEKGEQAFVICTGNQGEPNAVLTKIADKRLPYQLDKSNCVLFACEVVPTPVNEANRAQLEAQLKKEGARIFKDLHASGHAYREDLRELIRMLQPEYYIPTHGTMKKIMGAVELAREEGYEVGKNVFIMQNGESIELK